MLRASISSGAAFPAAAYMRDMRAAGGDIGLHKSGIYFQFGDRTSAVMRDYIAAMNVHADNGDSAILAELEAEAAAAV